MLRYHRVFLNAHILSKGLVLVDLPGKYTTKIVNTHRITHALIKDFET